MPENRTGHLEPYPGDIHLVVLNSLILPLSTVCRALLAGSENTLDQEWRFPKLLAYDVGEWLESSGRNGL